MKSIPTPLFTVHGRTLDLKGLGRGMRGFTLIELLIALVIAAILAVLAVPSFNNLTLSTKLNSIANSFVASAHLARSEAIKRNATVTLCASSNGTSCTGGWADGWVILAGGAVIQSQASLPSGYVLSEASAVTSIDFMPTGMGATTAALTLCRATPSVGLLQRGISVSMTGRPDVEKITGASSCP